MAPLGYTHDVRELLRGTMFERFLGWYHDGVRGAQLWQRLRRSPSFSSLTNAQVSLVYQRYSQAAAATDTFLRYPRSQPPPLSSIPINPYLDVMDRVTDRVNYYIRVRASVAGERSVHERIIRVRSDVPLSRAELSNMIGEEFAKYVYTKQGVLASETDLPIIAASIEYLGVVRKW